MCPCGVQKGRHGNPHLRDLIVAAKPGHTLGDRLDDVVWMARCGDAPEGVHHAVCVDDTRLNPGTSEVNTECIHPA